MPGRFALFVDNQPHSFTRTCENTFTCSKSIRRVRLGKNLFYKSYQEIVSVKVVEKHISAALKELRAACKMFFNLLIARSLLVSYFLLLRQKKVIKKRRPRTKTFLRALAASAAHFPEGSRCSWTSAALGAGDYFRFFVNNYLLVK